MKRKQKPPPSWLSPLVSILFLIAIAVCLHAAAETRVKHAQIGINGVLNQEKRAMDSVLEYAIELEIVPQHLATIDQALQVAINGYQGEHGRMWDRMAASFWLHDQRHIPARERYQVSKVVNDDQALFNLLIVLQSEKPARLTSCLEVQGKFYASWFDMSCPSDDVLSIPSLAEYHAAQAEDFEASHEIASELWAKGVSPSSR